MRIALVSTPFVAVPPRSYGGTELIVHELLRGLTADGHRVTLFATGDSQARDLRYLYGEAVWPPDSETEIRHCAASARMIAAERFDLVHAHSASLLACPVDLGAPVVYTIHHDHNERLSNLYLRHPEVRYVAISARQAELEPSLKCQVVHHGLDPSCYPAGAGEGDYAVFLGRLAPVKGPDLAVAAARRARVPIRVAGMIHEADASPEWKARLVRAFGAPGVVHLGSVGGARKTALLAAARALLMPLRWEEPFGLVMIEAMLCGTPVIAFPRGAAPELIDEGLTGFLARDVDEMAAILAQLSTFDREGCRRRAQTLFSAARMVRDYERVYAVATAGAMVTGSAEESSYAG